MLKSEQYVLKCLSERIVSLASLENAGFTINNPEKDKEIKEAIKPYMTWFESCAFVLDDLATGRKTAKDIIDNEHYRLT